MTISQQAVSTAVDEDKLFIPLIDFGMFLNGDAADKAAVAKGVVDGFRNAGFIYLKNHGIPKETVDTVFAESAAFFRRPQEQKDELAWYSPAANRGYVATGREKVTQITDKAAVAQLRSQNPDLKESMEIGRDDGAAYANRWPEDGGGERFRATMVTFFETCAGLHVRVMGAIALGMGLADERFFDSFVDARNHTLRLLHYPATPADTWARDPARVRAGKHTDYGSVTLLFQDARGGLQVRSPLGTWVDATPIDGAIVVNAGDLLACWSNDRIRSTEHQVVEPPRGQRGEGAVVDGVYPPRYSCAYFCNPNADAFIEALPGTWEGEEDGKRYPGVNVQEYLTRRLAETYS